MNTVQSFTLHTHTTGFDGKNTVSEMAAAARDVGMTTIGISNHFIVHPDIKSARMYRYAVRGGYDAIYSASFDEVLEKIRPHYDEINRIAEKSNVRILRGIEVDFFDTPQWRDGFAHAMRILRPDYCIGAAHFVYHNGNLCNMHDIANATPDDRAILLNKYWDNIASAGASGLFDWMAHLDLPKKVGAGRGDEWAAAEERAVRAIADVHGRMEINTGLFRPNCYEPYPSPRIMRMVAKYNVPVLLSDDAHAAAHIGRNFDVARDMATRCGIQNFCNIDSILSKTYG